MELWGSAWAQLGAVGLLAVVVMAIVVGRLVSRSWVNTLLDQANRETERWRAAFVASDARADLNAQQLGEALALMRTVESLVRQPTRKDSA